MTDNINVPNREPGNVHLEDVTTAAMQSPIFSMIAHAIQGYAALEQSLCHLMMHTTGMAPDVAGIIFFKITNAQARNSILERLIRKKHGNTYNAFWNSYLKTLRSVDTKRNEIVHWNILTSVDMSAEDYTKVSLQLTPPNFWDRDVNTPAIGPEDLLDFMAKCNVYSRIVTMFIAVASGKAPDETANTWRDIFTQTFVYPLPNGHPLNTVSSAPEPEIPDPVPQRTDVSDAAHKQTDLSGS